MVGWLLSSSCCRTSSTRTLPLAPPPTSWSRRASFNVSEPSRQSSPSLLLSRGRPCLGKLMRGRRVQGCEVDATSVTARCIYPHCLGWMGEYECRLCDSVGILYPAVRDRQGVSCRSNGRLRSWAGGRQPSASLHLCFLLSFYSFYSVLPLLHLLCLDPVGSSQSTKCPRHLPSTLVLYSYISGSHLAFPCKAPPTTLSLLSP